MSRQTYLMGLGIVLVALAFVVTDEFVPGTPGRTARNVKRIRRGMTAAEVEALFGNEQSMVGIPKQGLVEGTGADWELLKEFFENPQDQEEMATQLQKRMIDDAQIFLNSLRRQLHSHDGLLVVFRAEREGGAAIVCFGAGGRVRWAEWRQWDPAPAPNTPFLDRLRSWLGW